jgi:outer membrane autotransporter protein
LGARLWRGGERAGLGRGGGLSGRSRRVPAGADTWLNKTLVVGVAAGYTNTNANFADGSLTTLNSYQGAAYAGWRQGPWYATASAGASVNNFTSTRQLAPFGLSGAALSNPSGASFSGTGEVGYGLELARLTVTPVAGLAYVHTHIDGFSEAGGFGALTTAAADADSLQTILGARLSTRLAVGNRFGPLVPELRVGWAHELLDAAQSLNAALVNVPGSAFSATGANLGRDSALLGAGVTQKVSAATRLFADYDGRFTGSFQEHAFSAGLRMSF